MKTNVLAGFVLAMVLIGCSNPPTNEKSAQQKLLGEWIMTKCLTTDLRNNQTQQMDIVASDSIWRFTEDSLYEHHDRLNSTIHYEIKKDDSGLVIYRDMGDIEVGFIPLRIISLTDKELILQTVDTWSGLANDYNFISGRYEFSRYSYHHEPIVYDEKWAQQMMIGYWVATGGTVAYSESPGEWSFKNLDSNSIQLYSYAEWLIDKENIFFNPLSTTADVRYFPYELKVSGNWYEMTAPGLFDLDPEAPHNAMDYIPDMKSPATIYGIGKYEMSWTYYSGWNGERYTCVYDIHYEKRTLPAVVCTF